MRDNTIKKTIIKIAYFIVLLITSIFVISKLSNVDNADMTAKMPSATLPVITMQSGDIEVNPLHGYLSKVDVNYIRGTVWPVNEDLTMAFKIKTYGTKISDVGFEVRSIDGKRLIQDEKLEDLSEHDENIDCKIRLKNFDIISGREYMLVIKMETPSGTAKYYTRVVWTEDSERYNIDKEIAFVTDFSEATFDKKKASSEYRKYLEVDRDREDNDTFAKVNIHSTLDQITWGNLIDKEDEEGDDNKKDENAVKITKHTKPQVYVTDIQQQSGSYKLQYRMTTEDETGSKLYNVTEVFRVKYNSERPSLLNYERTVNCIFDTTSYSVGKNTITLGICDPKFDFKESGGVSEGGTVFAFVNENRLFSYNNADGRLAHIFGFYDHENDDVRTNWDNNIIRILDVEETGDVKFAVSGYMNRGIHEGRTGIAVYDYSSALNSVEEQAFIECGQSAEIIDNYVDTLAYVNDNNTFFVMIDQSVYEIDLASRVGKAVVEGVGSEAYKISESQSTIAWQGEDLTGFDVMNLDTKETMQVKAESGEYVVLLGYMGDALIYGVGRSSDVSRDQMGNPIYPMYRIVFQNKNGDVVKDKLVTDDRYITRVISIDKQINFKCVKKSESGEYVDADDYSMLDSVEKDNGRNIVSEVPVDNYEKIVQITTKNEIKAKQIRVLTPDQTLFEESRNVSGVELKRNAEKNPFYYAYNLNGNVKVYADSAKAVTYADQGSGVVVGDSNNYVWRKDNRLNFTSIASLKQKIAAYENITSKKSAAVCIDLILDHYRGVNVNVESALTNGDGVEDILRANMIEADVIELDGCTLKSVLYYVSKGWPVMALMNNDEAVLILGFENQKSVEILEPRIGSVHGLGMAEAEEWFKQNGNHFITYIPYEK